MAINEHQDTGSKKQPALSEESLSGRVGVLVKNLASLHDSEQSMMYNLEETTFFQKMISKGLLENGVRIRSADYFRGLLFLKYYTEVIGIEPSKQVDYKVCDDLVLISKSLRSQEQEGNKGKEEKDKKNTASYVNLGVVVVEAGLCMKEKDQNHLRAKASVNMIRSRYDENAKDCPDLAFPGARKPEPFYDAIGRKIVDSVDTARRQYLANATNRSELESIVFADAILAVIKKPAVASTVERALAKRDYFGASIIAMRAMASEATLSLLKAYISEDVK